MMMGFFTKLVNAKHFTNANILCRERQYREAYDELHKINITKIKVERFVEYLALRGFVAFCLERFDDAADCCEGVLKYTPEANKFSVDDKHYLEAYTARYYSDIVTKVTTITTPADIEKRLKYTKINLANVRPKLKRLFPLRGHPDWDDSMEE